MFRCFIEKCESIMKHPDYTKLFCPKCSTSINDLSKINYFTLYSLPQTYSLNKSDLNKKYKSFQLILHPDILQSKGIEDQNYSKILQDSYKTLSDDINRAKYLLTLNGIDSETLEIQDPVYIEEQFELRLKILEASQNDLNLILNDANLIFESYKSELEVCFSANEFIKAALVTAKLNFTQKIIDEAKDKLNFLT